MGVEYSNDVPDKSATESSGVAAPMGPAVANRLALAPNWLEGEFLSPVAMLALGEDARTPYPAALGWYK